MDIQKMLREAQKMQQQMQEEQAKLSAKEFEVSSCGGAIKIVIGGDREIKSLDISKDILSPEDKEMLQDALIVAIKEANELVAKEEEIIAAKATNGMNIPGF